MIHWLQNSSRDSGQVRSVELRPDGRWIVFARLLLLSLILMSLAVRSFFMGKESAEQVQFLYVPLAMLLGITGISALFLRWYRDSNWFFFGQLFIDVSLVTGVIYITGGPASPFLFLYLPLVMVAAVFLTRLHALILGAFSASAYISLAYLMVHQVLTPSDGSSRVHVPAGGIILQCIGLTSALILVAIATSFLRKNMKAGFQLAERSAESLQKLSAEQAKLRSYVKEIEEQVALQERMADLFSQPDDGDGLRFSHFVGESKLMEQVFRLIKKVSCSQATVLISGESGTGKVHEKCLLR
jgi:hypothetical protein